MKKYLLLSLLLTASIISIAQSKSEKQVAEAVQQFKKAMVDADTVTLEKLSSPKLSYGHSAGLMDTKETFIRSIASGKSDFASIDLSEQVITISGKTALVRHTFIGGTLDGGRPGTVKLHVLTVWQKSGRNWKMLARQAIRLT